MTADTRRQLCVLGALVAVYSLLAGAIYLIFPLDQLVPGQALPSPELTIPGWQLALAAQIDPDITPETFMSLAMETGRTIDVNHEGQLIPLGPILDPAALIQALKEGK